MTGSRAPTRFSNVPVDLRNEFWLPYASAGPAGGPGSCRLCGMALRTQDAYGRRHS